MEKLSVAEINERLKSPSKQVQSEKYFCWKHDIKAEFHTIPRDISEPNTYLGTFKYWVRDMIDEEKFKLFCHLLTTPIESVDFTEGVFDEFKKIYGAQDRYVRHSFKNPDLVQDYEEFLEENNEADFWKQDAFETMRSRINDILVIDLPKDQEGERPEPYQYFLCVQNVVDCKFNRKKEFDWIIFNDPKDKYRAYYYDLTEWMSFTRGDTSEWVIESQSEHGLGWTPAKSFWGIPKDNESVLQKLGPITNSLGRLDWLLLSYTFSKHEELYAGYPIDIFYERKCSYVDKKTHARCSDGMLYSRGGETTGWAEEVIGTCPQCGGTGQGLPLGPGTRLEAPAPVKGGPDLINGVNRVGADVKSLEWISGKIKSREQDIKWNITGFMQEQSREAMNEMQVSGNYETRENVLKDVRDQMQSIHNWSLNTRGKLRYGDSYIGTSVHYGDKLFLMTTDAIEESIKKAVESGMPTFEVVNQQQDLIKTRHQNNPEMLERMELLSQLEPFQGYKHSDLMSYKDNLDPDQLTLKINFASYIHRFEREFIDIVKFLQFSDIGKKVTIIQQTLMSYVKEDREKVEQQRRDREEERFEREGGGFTPGQGQRGPQTEE